MNSGLAHSQWTLVCCWSSFLMHPQSSIPLTARLCNFLGLGFSHDGIGLVSRDRKLELSGRIQLPYPTANQLWRYSPSEGCLSRTAPDMLRVLQRRLTTWHDPCVNMKLQSFSVALVLDFSLSLQLVPAAGRPARETRQVCTSWTAVARRILFFLIQCRARRIWIR